MPKFQPGNPGGPGRPRKAEKYAGPIAAAEDWIADRLPQLLAEQYRLAIGGYERVEDTYAPAGTVTIGSGDNLTLVFPDKQPDELVLVKRSVNIADADRAAGQYLIDRILGKPTQGVELTGAEGERLFPDQLTDDERAARIAELLDRGRARHAGLLPDGEPGELPGLA